MIGFSLWSLQSAGFVSTPTLSFPPREESGQDGIEVCAIHHSEHVAIGHLTRHRASRQSEALHQGHPTMTDPISGPAQRRLSCQFGQDDQTQHQCHGIALALTTSGISEVLQRFVE